MAIEIEEKATECLIEVPSPYPEQGIKMNWFQLRYIIGKAGTV
jgi:hypothetical protein